jgi:hypothetical protein
MEFRNNQLSWSDSSFSLYLFRLGDTYSMTPTQRIDIQECKHLIRLEKLERRNIPYDATQLAPPALPLSSNSSQLNKLRGLPLIILQKMQAAEDAILVYALVAVVELLDVDVGGMGW